jgi:hypothetical protein
MHKPQVRAADLSGELASGPPHSFPGELAENTSGRLSAEGLSCPFHDAGKIVEGDPQRMGVHRHNLGLAIICGLPVISSIFVGLRLVARWRRKIRTGWGMCKLLSLL